MTMITHLQADNAIESVKELDNLKNLEVLHLRNNKLKSFDGLEALPSLRYLNVRDNQITDFASLEKLKENSSLQTIVLKGNAISKENSYRVEVLIVLQQLQKLDKDRFEDEGNC